MPSASKAWAAASPAARLRARWELETRYPVDRPQQRTPPGDWNVWLILAGRGFGKTRTGAEDMVHFARTNPGARIAVVAPTTADARDTCIEGESGILSCLDPSEIIDWNRSMGELVMVNGSRFKTFSGDRPDRLRGPQHHRAWCDELAAFRYPETWDMLQLGLRLGDRPQVVVTTTPKPSKHLRALIARDDVVISRGSTYDNMANLAATAVAALKRQYEGSRMGRQELHGELIEDVVGAMWTWARIEEARVPDAAYWMPQQIGRTVVAVDPATTAKDESDETGIVTGQTIIEFDDDMAAAWGMEEPPTNPHVVVLDDRSGTYTPTQWARKAIGAYYEFEADCIVAESNQGGEMVSQTLHALDPNVPVILVHASKGKRTRAEPVSALYEQGRVHHVEPFPVLEDEMTTWVPGEASPNHMDALVWLVTELLIAPSTGFVMEPVDTEHPTSLTGDLLEKQW